MLDKNVSRQVTNTLNEYNNIDNLEQVPIDVLRCMYKDILNKYNTLCTELNKIDSKQLNSTIQVFNCMVFADYDSPMYTLIDRCVPYLKHLQKIKHIVKEEE